MILRRFALITPLLALTLLSHAAGDADERTGAAYLLVFGRLPGAAEQAAPDFSRDMSVAECLSILDTRMQDDPALAREVGTKAWRDTFGTLPPGGEIIPTVGTYTDLVHGHVARLVSDRAAYREVIARAYRRVATRAPHDGEFTYWLDRDTLPYIALVACIEHWAQRNAPGLMSTAGEPTISVHSAHLVTLRLSPSVADEVRSAVGLSPADPWASARRRHVIMPDAESVASAGGIHFVAAGAD